MVREIDLRPYEGKPIIGSIFLPGNQRLEITTNPASVLTVNGLEGLYLFVADGGKPVFQWLTDLRTTQLREPLAAYCNEYLGNRGINPECSTIRVFIGNQTSREIEPWQTFLDIEKRSIVEGYFTGSSIVIVDCHPTLGASIITYHREQRLETNIRVPAEERDLEALTAFVFKTSKLKFRSIELTGLQKGIRTLLEEAKTITNVYKLR